MPQATKFALLLFPHIADRCSGVIRKTITVWSAGFSFNQSLSLNKWSRNGGKRRWVHKRKCAFKSQWWLPLILILHDRKYIFHWFTWSRFRFFSRHFRSTCSCSISLSLSISAIKGLTRKVKTVVCPFSVLRGQLCLVSVVRGNIGVQLRTFACDGRVCSSCNTHFLRQASFVNRMVQIKEATLWLTWSFGNHLKCELMQQYGSKN